MTPQPPPRNTKQNGPWGDFKDAGGVPRGHDPSDFPEGFGSQLPISTPPQPIDWGEKISGEEFPDDKGSPSDSCRCEKQTSMSSIARPPNQDVTFPRPGSGKSSSGCGSRRIVVKKYKGRCVESSKEPYSEDCGDCEDKSCSFYIKWECKPRGRRGQSNWGAVGSMQMGKCQ